MPSLPDNEQSCNTDLAASVAINIVTQVLDEAEDILNAAHELGQPWRNVWRNKKGYGEFYENTNILGILDIKVDESDIDKCDTIQSNSVIVTSTPQKEIDYIPKTYDENSFRGQGDEDIQTRSDLRSPSMLISCLFDMSDVEQTGTIEIFDDVQGETDTRDFNASLVAKLVESYVNLALNTVCGDGVFREHQGMAESIEDSSISSYSLMTDALVNEDTENENETYYIDNIKSEDDDQRTTKLANDEDLKECTNKDIELYEKTFLTLNRDYEKYSEEEDNVLDEKNFTMQEVELMTNKCENLALFSEPKHVTTKEEDLGTSVVLESTHKNSLVKRCRLQGAKLMSRLRCWWWKQRLIGKRKESRSGMCPLSPKMQENFTASLLHHGKLRSPSPMRTTAWKFNTVNEALVHSYNMKEYDFGLNTSDPVEKY